MAIANIPLTAICGLLVIFVANLFIRSYLKNPKYKLPNHVPGVPVFGNTFQIPLIQQGPWAKALADKYGEM